MDHLLPDWADASRQDRPIAIAAVVVVQAQKRGSWDCPGIGATDWRRRAAVLHPERGGAWNGPVVVRATTGRPALRPVPLRPSQSCERGLYMSIPQACVRALASDHGSEVVLGCSGMRRSPARARWWADVLDWQLVFEADDEATIVPKHAQDQRISAEEWSMVGPGLVFVPVSGGRARGARITRARL